MSSLTNEECVTRYAAASAAMDLDAMASLRHPDWMVSWPQSGERVRGTQAFAEIIANYPGGSPVTEVTRIVGAEDRWVVTAGNTVLKVVGSGDFWWSEYRLTYPNGDTYLVVDLMELRDGLVYRETVYWAAPFEAPDWRAPWVVRA
jgi:SnoaL-like domain